MKLFFAAPACRLTVLPREKALFCDGHHRASATDAVSAKWTHGERWETTRLPAKKFDGLRRPDAELLALGIRFIEEEAQALRAEAAFEELHNQILHNVESIATWPADPDKWTREDAAAYCSALKRFSDAAGEPYRDACSIRDWAWERRDETAEIIRASAPETPEGLAIKALVPPRPDDDKEQDNDTPRRILQ